MRQKPKTASPMSNEGRNTYVMEHLTEALLELLHKKSIDEISVSELCNRAGVGRASFYRNFKSKEDILEQFVSKMFEQWQRDCESNANLPLSDLLGMLFSHFENNRNFYSLLNEKNLIYLLKDRIIKICGLEPGLPKAEAYAKAFAAYSLYGWVEVWFQRGMQESAEEIRQLFQNQNL